MPVRVEDVRYVPVKEAVQYPDIGWLPELNIRKQYGSDKETRTVRDMLATHLGWDAQYPAIAETATEDEIEKILVGRLAAWHALRAAVQEAKLLPVTIPEGGKNVNVDGRDFHLAKLAVFNWCYVNPKAKEPKDATDDRWKLKRPKFIGTTGNRRGSVLLDSMAIQLVLARREKGDDKLQPEAVADQLTTHIHLILPDTPTHRFPDPAVRMQAQIRENETKTEGFKKMSDVERITAVLKLTEDYGKSQSDIRNSGYGPTLGLRLYFATIIDIYCRQMAREHGLTKEIRKLWEGIRYVARLCAPQFLNEEDEKNSHVNPDWLDFGKFQQKAFQGDKDNPAMGLMCETDRKFDKENARRASKELSPLERPTPDVVQEWISKNMTGQARAAQQLPRANINNLAQRDKNPFVKDAMKAVDNNDESLLNNAHERAAGCDYLYGCSKEAYEQVVILFTGLHDLEDSQQVDLLHEFATRALESVGTEVEAFAEADAPASAE